MSEFTELSGLHQLQTSALSGREVSLARLDSQCPEMPFLGFLAGAE
jgi:hypothetical protein